MNNAIQLMSKKLIKIISQEYNLNNIEKAKVKFGLEVIISTIFKLTVLLATFYILGVFYQSFFAMYSFGFLRLASGGYHCNTYSKCLIVSLLAFSLIGLVSNTFVITNVYYYTIAIFLLLITVYKAPVDPFQRPINSKKRKYIMKIISSSIIILLIVLPVELNLNNNLKNAMLLAISFQVFTLTGYGHRTYLFISQLNFKKGGGE